MDLYYLPDIYFQPKYGKLYETHENADYKVYELKCEYGHVYYGFLKRPIPLVDGKMFDTITPHGYGGPIILHCTPGAEEELIMEFDKELSSFFHEERIICEYVRFHPLLMNHVPFAPLYKPVTTKKIVAIDLTIDFFMNFQPRRRSLVRKLEKEGITIDMDFDGKHLSLYLDAYKQTMKRNHALSYHNFDKDYYMALFNNLNENAFFLHARYENKIISSALFLHGDIFLHYHLGATFTEHTNKNAFSLVLYHACKWGKSNGKQYFILGGGRTPGDDDDLLLFKSRFAKNGLTSYYTGERVHCYESYEKLNKEAAKLPGWNPNYFPAYRSVLLE